MRQELEKIKRRLETELADIKDQLSEKATQLEELQAQMNKREEDLQKALNRLIISGTIEVDFKLTDNLIINFRTEEEVSSKTATMKQLRELESRIQELQEDLESEKEGRQKAEKLKRDLGEACY